MLEGQMDIVIDIIFTSGSYLIITYFIYTLFHRNKRIAFGIYALLLIFGIYNVVENARIVPGLTSILGSLLSGVVPVIIAFIAFSYITGEMLIFLPKRHRKLKNISFDVDTKRKKKIFSIVMIISAIVFGTYFYIVLEDWVRYVVLGIAAIILGYGGYQFISISNIVIEDAILILGKDQKTYYVYQFPINLWKITPTDIYQHDDYIIDPIGMIDLITDDKKHEHHYLYWLATNQTIDPSNFKHLKQIQPTYTDIIDTFDKFHYMKKQVIKSQDSYEIIRTKKIR